MKIVGRSNEKKHIRDILDSKKHELIAVWGRRRVGKTWLVTNGVDKLKNESDIFLVINNSIIKAAQ